MTRPALSTIPPGLPFLDTLAGWWLRRAGPDPGRTGDALFILPTRRAARGLAEAFLRVSGGAPMLLPRIMPLGGVDEAPLAMAGALDIPEAVAPDRRLAVLCRLILAMGGQHGVPTTVDRAWLLAADLASLLDEAARAEVDLRAALHGAVGPDFAAHWNVTLEFLRIVTEFWPAWLAEEGLVDPVGRQIALLDAQTRAWQAAPPAHPVIAAGSTGAIPAVARLLNTVAHLPTGFVVLPGLDLDLDEQSWAALDETHPQASLRALLAELGAVRGDVRAWTEDSGVTDIVPPGAPATRLSPPGRAELLRRALLPAASLGQWREAPPPDMTGLHMLEAADEQEEAVAIAMILRDALEQPGARAALVTPDRGLARRVGAMLRRFSILADDSAGEALAATPPAVFLRLLAVAFAEQFRPVALLALIKHPFCAAGLAPVECRGLARRLELACLRGAAPGPGFEGLRAAENADPDFLDRLDRCIEPLATAGPGPADLLRGLVEAAEALATTDERSGAEILWQGADGEALADRLTALLPAFAELPSQADAQVLPGLLDAALAGEAVQNAQRRDDPGALHPRIHIWGLLEARLQSAETIVLGGLSEGVWPPAVEPGPWMNRGMRRLAKMPSPEEAVGRAAHDFVAAACAAPRVILSMPRRRERAPVVPARWLIRIQGFLAGASATLPLHDALDWVRCLDRPAGPPVPVRPPSPRPPVALRPRRLSVTEIETWLRDPYAIFAKHVLLVRKLPPLEESADAADYGRIVHAALQAFHAGTGADWPPDAAAQLVSCMDAALDGGRLRASLAAWWRPRLHRIAAWLAQAEASRRSTLRPNLIHSELKGAYVIAGPAGAWTLTGRADRIERLVQGGIAILDYKTGVLPKQKDVDRGLAPQLPLEAAMAARGAFGDDVKGRTIDLTYWRISGGFEPGEALQLFKGDADRTQAAADDAADRLAALVASYDSPERAYLSQPHPGSAPRLAEYAHLARTAEWSESAED